MCNIASSIKIRRFKSLQFLFLSLLLPFSSPLAQEEPETPPPLGMNKEFDLKAPLKLGEGVEFACESEVYFTWERKPPPATNGEVPAEQEPIKEFYTRVGQKGLVGTDVKARLQASLERVKAEAFNHCRRFHENQSNCISKRLRENAQDFSLLDFATRRVILDAATEDCNRNLGICKVAEATEIACHLSRSPDVPLKVEVEEENPEAAGKKDGKKKR